MATWRPDFDPLVVADRIERSKTVTDGTVSFVGFAHTEHLSILMGMLSLNSEIPESEVRRIVSRSVSAAALEGAVTPDSIKEHVVTLEKAYLAQPKRRFRLLTSISAAFPSGPLRFRYESAQLCFGWRVPKVASAAHARRVEDAKHSIHGEMPRFYSPVSVLLDARNPDEAAARSLDQLDLHRAIWNLWKNRSHGIRISSGRQSPVNAIILGPVHTLHDEKGELASDAWWYEPSYLGEVSVWRDIPRREKMNQFTAHVRGSLRKLPYSDAIASTLVRYVRALDLRDWNSCLLQLWSILESLTGTGVRDNHRVTVRRAAFLFKNTDYAVQVLSHLRDYRNTAVHTGKQSQYVETLMYQAKNFVEALLNFHLSRAGQFKSIADVAAFLDQPPGLAEIDIQLARLRTARKYLVG